MQTVSSSGSTTGSNEVGPSTIATSWRRFGSVYANRRASCVNWQATASIWRVSQLHASSISETTSSITGSLGRGLRMRQLTRGQSVGNLAIDAAAIGWGGDAKRGINGMKSLVASIHQKTPSLENKGSLSAQCCNANRTSKVIRSTANRRIPRAYFRNRFHSPPRWEPIERLPRECNQMKTSQKLLGDSRIDLLPPPRHPPAKT